MTESGDPKDNSQAERINNTMKNELFKGMKFCCIQEVQQDIDKAVNLYNNRRPNMSINMMAPVQTALCGNEIEKKWTSYREQAIETKQEESETVCLEISENASPLTPTLG